MRKIKMTPQFEALVHAHYCAQMGVDAFVSPLDFKHMLDKPNTPTICARDARLIEYITESDHDAREWNREGSGTRQ